MNFSFWKGAGSRVISEADLVSPTWESSGPPFTQSNPVPTKDDIAQMRWGRNGTPGRGRRVCMPKHKNKDSVVRCGRGRGEGGRFVSNSCS